MAVRPLPLEPCVLVFIRNTPSILIHCIQFNTEFIMRKHKMLQHFLVNSQTIIKQWYFHMKFNTHILDILYNNLQQTFYP